MNPTKNVATMVKLQNDIGIYYNESIMQELSLDDKTSGWKFDGKQTICTVLTYLLTKYLVITQWGKKKTKHFLMEKQGKPHFNQVIKVNILIMGHTNILCLLIWCTEDVSYLSHTYLKQMKLSNIKKLIDICF